MTISSVESPASVYDNYDNFPQLSPEDTQWLLEYNKKNKPKISAENETSFPVIDLSASANASSGLLSSPSVPTLNGTINSENWQD